MRTPAAYRPAEMFVEAVAGRVWRADVPVRLPVREAEIVVFLAAQQSPVDPATLSRLLYLDRDPDKAKNMVKVTVSRIRSRLGREFIVFRDRGYRLGAGVTVDLDECRAVLLRVQRSGAHAGAEERRRWIRLARGLRQPAPAAFLEAPWFEPVERSARRIGRDIPIALARLALERDDPREALAIAAEIADEDPCDEEATELVIRAELRLGRYLTALRAFRTHETLVRDELDAVPSPFLAQLLAGRDAVAI